MAAATGTKTREAKQRPARKKAPKRITDPATLGALATWGHDSEGRVTCLSPRSEVTHHISEEADGRLFCSCPAGMNGIACWHIAAYALKQQATKSGVMYGYIVTDASRP